MTWQLDWENIFRFGSMAGLYLLIKDMIHIYNRPKLIITFDKERDLRIWNFKDTKWIRKFANLHIKNIGKYTATRCVAIMKVLKKPNNAINIQDEYSLHWADLEYTLATASEQTTDIGRHQRRLDVVFTQREQSIEGAWVSMGLALSGDLDRNQAYFPPGEYEVEIEVTCESGSGDRKMFRITSPNQWEDLFMEPLSK